MSDVVSEHRKLLLTNLLGSSSGINPFHAYQNNSREKYKNKQFIKVQRKNENLKYANYLALAFYMLSTMTHWKMNKN